MKSLSLYLPRDTFIHRQVDPFTKLIFFVCAIITAFFIPSYIGAGVLLVFNFILLAWARELARTGKLLLGILLLLLSIFFIQGMFYPDNETLLWTVGPIGLYKEGLLFALKVVLRIMNILAAGALLVLTTSPSGLMEACMRRGLSPKAGYMVTSIFQLIPLMMRRAGTIQDAQESRGMNVRGNVWTRFKAFIPLLAPLIMSSFVSIQERAMALDVRGFSAKGKKTYYNEENVARGMVFIRAAILTATLAILVWRIVL